MSKPRIAWAHATVDSCLPARAANFWGRLLDLEPVEREGGWYVLGPTAPDGPMLYFQPVPESKTGKTRVHIDLWVDDLPAAIALVEELGGHLMTESHEVRSGTLAVMADPDGTGVLSHHVRDLIAFPIGRSGAATRGQPALADWREFRSRR